MNWMRRLLNSFRNERLNHDLNDELSFHIEMAARDRMSQGLSEQEARREAHLKFGNVTLQQERTRDANVVAWLDGLWRDVRHAVRGLRRRPGFLATALASLALGIGANSAIFSVVDAVLLKPLPVPDPERLVAVKEFNSRRPTGGNPARLHDWRTQVEAFQSAAAWYGENVVYAGGGEPRRLSMLRTFGGVTETLAVAPALGRTFTSEEERGEGQPVALLSHAAWQRVFGADPAILGRTLKLSGAQFTVIGVLPASLTYPEDVDLWSPGPLEVQRASRKAGFLGVVARLRPGVSMEQAQAQIDTVAGRMRSQYPESDAELTAQAGPVLDEVAGEARAPLLVLLAAASIVLVLACVNLANLLLARAGERARESAIRAALGAGRAGLIRLYLTESVVLAAAGGALGLLVALSGIDLLKTILPEELPRLAQTTLDGRVVGFAMLLTLLCAALFGVAPAWRAAQVSLNGVMKQKGGGFRASLVVVQVSLSVTLVVGAALMAATFFNLRRQPLGFQATQILTVRLDQPWNTDKPVLDRFQGAALERFRAIPGVRLAGLADRLPLAGGSQTGPVKVRGRALPAELEKAPVGHRGYAGDYFQALNVPLLAGRWPKAEREALVNETFAKRYFPHEDPLGKLVGFDDKQWLEVTGVVGDLRQEPGRAPMPEVFADMRTVYWPMAGFVLRAQGDPAALTGAVREQIRALDPEFIPGPIQTMEIGLGRTIASERTRAGLIGGFALIALLLASIGIYGLLAGDVVRRRQEIGIRVALGARPPDVLAVVLARGARLVAVGLALGLAGALALSGSLTALLYGVRPTDPAIYGAAAAVAAAAAALACYLPALRAARLDPLAALRHE